jgi:hypothetical protein
LSRKGVDEGGVVNVSDASDCGRSGDLISSVKCVDELLSCVDGAGVLLRLCCPDELELALFICCEVSVVRYKFAAHNVVAIRNYASGLHIVRYLVGILSLVVPFQLNLVALAHPVDFVIANKIMTLTED